MPAYESVEQFQKIFSEFWNRALEVTEVVDKIRKEKIIVRFDIEEPDLKFWLNFRDPGPDGTIGTLSWDSGEEPTVAVWSKSETTNKFWQGKLSTAAAVAKGQVKISGSAMKAISLASKIKPLFTVYRDVLKDMGMDEYIIE
ncbi:MAG: SCP2 sterol-binding domain-containing protein [Promethearchaeota archaeon]